MNPKESPTGDGRDSQNNRLVATEGISQNSDEVSSTQYPPARKVPRPGTKTRLLLDALRNARGREVSLPSLTEVTHLAAVHSGVATLRKGGWDINNRMEHHPFDGGTEIHSFYQLVESTES
jgi:hypothetical protein